MALHSFIPDPSNEPRKHAPNSKRKIKGHQHHQITKQTSSWDQIKNLLTCKQINHQNSSKIHNHHHPSKNPPPNNIYSTCSNICKFRDVVVHGNTRVVHRPDKSSLAEAAAAVGPETRQLLSKKSSYHGSSSSINSSGGGGGGAAYTMRGLQLRKLSGCYECHAIVDPTRYPLPITTICTCPECGEAFPKIESLEHHQAVRHAVSELGPDDSSRNIVEIIFKSSWLKKDNPICQIERILKVHNTPRTIQRFEDYRNSVKTRANSNAKRNNARCAADGNELLRFHPSTLTCSLGARGSSSLCGSIPACGVCTIIRHGFQQSNKINGIRTTASSGRADDCLGDWGTRRAMLVCRVIAGRVKRVTEVAVAADEDGSAALTAGSYDSLAGCVGVSSNMEELCVFSSRAILPCFVVIYSS